MVAANIFATRTVRRALIPHNSYGKSRLYTGLENEDLGKCVGSTMRSTYLSDGSIIEVDPLLQLGVEDEGGVMFTVVTHDCGQV